MKVRNILKKTLSVVLVLAMMAPIMGNLASNVKEVKANETTSAVTSVDTLDVKFQVTQGVVDESNIEAYIGKYVMRAVSSVQNPDAYDEIGFKAVRHDQTIGKSEEEIEKLATKALVERVFKRIESTTGSAKGTKETYTYSPKVVDTNGEYFATAKFVIAADKADVDYVVWAYGIINGQEVKGSKRQVCVNDGMVGCQTINMSFENTNGVDLANVTELKANDYDADVIGVYGDTVNVRIEGVDQSTLKSATKFELKTTAGNTVGTEILRNHNIKYNGTADTSWYDVDPDAKVFTIATSADLYGMASLANNNNNTFADTTIYVVRDIAVNPTQEGTAATWAELAEGTVPEGVNVWTAVKSFAGTFDGQMHTISGVYLNIKDKEYNGLFGTIEQTGNVSNLYIKDSIFKANWTKLGSVAGQCKGTISTVYSDAYVVGTYQHNGGIVGFLPQSASVDNCWFDGEIRIANSSSGYQSGGIVGYIDGSGTYNLTNCLYTGKLYFTTTNTSAWGRKIGGIIGGAHDWDTPTINMENCLSAGTMECSTNKNATGINGISSVFGGLDTEALKLNFVNVYGTNECYADAKQIYDFYQGTTAIITGKGLMKNEADLQGVAGYTNTLLDFEDTWVAREDDVPALKAFTNEIGATVDITGAEQNNWYNANETVFGIGSASALKSLGTISETNDFVGKTILLLDDIEVNKVEEGTLDAWKAETGTLPASWTPIGAKTRFNGTFDGQMHTISGIYLNTSSRYAGLFGQIYASGVVKNLYITDSLFKSTNTDLGSVVGASYGTVDSVYSNATVIAGGYRIGGIVGSVPWHSIAAYIKNCWFDGEMELVGDACQAGGILGYIADEWDAAASITNCLYTGSIDFQSTSTQWGLRIGGIVGGAKDSWKVTITIEDCLSAGKITQSSGSTDTPAVSAVYGGFDEGRATTLNLTNVYATKECFAEARIYHQYIAKEGVTGATQNITGTGTLLAEATLYGELAKTNASDLDYSAVWVTREGKVPALKLFADKVQ